MADNLRAAVAFAVAVSCGSIHDIPSDLNHISYAFHLNTSGGNLSQYTCPTGKPFRCKKTADLDPNGSVIPLCLPQAYVRDGYYDCVYPYLGGPAEIGLILDKSDEQSTEAFNLVFVMTIVLIGGTVLVLAVAWLIKTTIEQYQEKYPVNLLRKRVVITMEEDRAKGS